MGSPDAEDVMGEFEQAVLLAILHLGDNAYGMEIRTLIEERTGRDVAIGAMYTTLERLSRKGYVSSRVGEPTAERGGRAKKFYAVEEPGREPLARAEEFMRRMRGEPSGPGRHAPDRAGEQRLLVDPVRPGVLAAVNGPVVLVIVVLPTCLERCAWELA